MTIPEQFKLLGIGGCGHIGSHMVKCLLQAQLFLDAGIIALTAFISAFRKDREGPRALVPHGEFLEICCRCPLEVCEERDVKGLDKRAHADLIPDFTDISSPYEEPDDPELVVETGSMPLDQCVDQVIDLLRQRAILGNAA